jgi:hypothetical protein
MANLVFEVQVMIERYYVEVPAIQQQSYVLYALEHYFRFGPLYLDIPLQDVYPLSFPLET